AFDARRRKDRSRFLLAVTGGDGHHAVLSWAEIDADFGDAPVLLATRMDGRPLEPDGSQLVMPRDRCGA
ncbi:molybdopterin-dependent oxidoreductase, partial [Streptomyces sp. SID7982]|nr:molybdopterin-dependent oxidoreductase [Streptomyces sp. SID7982]